MCKIKIYIFTTERSRETCLIQVVIDYWTSQLRYSSIFIFNIKIFKYLSFCFCIITIKLFIQLLKIVSGLNSNIDKKLILPLQIFSIQNGKHIKLKTTHHKDNPCRVGATCSMAHHFGSSNFN